MSPRIRALLALLLVFAMSITMLAGCDGDGSETTDDVSEETTDDEGMDEDSEDSATDEDDADDESSAADGGDLAWLDYELTDAITGETFRISDYKGTPVLLHAFAVW